MNSTKNNIVRIIIICAFVFGLFNFGYSQLNHSVQFDRPKMEIRKALARDGNNYSEIKIRSLKRISDPGKPCLPVKYIKLIIPSDKDIDSISIKKTNIEKSSVSNQIYPAQPDVPISADKKPDFAGPDPEVYRNNSYYPSKSVKLVNSGYFDGSNHIVTLAVYPVQYNPVRMNIVFIGSIDFKLHFKSGGKRSISVSCRSPKNQTIYDNILKKIVNNPEDIPTYQRKPSLSKSSSLKSGSLPYYEYVIITSSSYTSYFADFVSWKKRKGLDIGIVEIGDITSNYSGDTISGINDNAGDLRQYLSDAYQSGTVWALLGGDHDIVPVRYGAGSDNCSWSSSSKYRIPADLYYSDFNGDWHVDTNDDNKYGEPNDDSPDYYSEIFIGRLPFESSSAQQDIENWTEKVLRYEQDPGKGNNSYLTNAYWVEGWNIYGDNEPDVVKTHCPSQFSHTVHDFDVLGTTLDGDMVVGEMSKDYGILNWHCHGHVDYFNVNEDPNSPCPFVETYDNGSAGLNSMTNAYPSIVYSTCCEIAAFDDFESATERSMAEGFTVKYNDNCGPNLIGNTRYGYMYASPELQMKFYDLIDESNPELELGVLNAVSKEIYESNDSTGSGHYVRYSCNLFGCPETQLWTTTPSKFTNVDITDNGGSITIDANVSGCVISASSGNDGSSYHLSVSDVTSYTFSTSERPLYITITKDNYLPYTAVTGGTFTSDEVWFEKMKVVGDLEIASGNELKIEPGTDVTFKSNASIEINGTLNAQGTSSDPIVFTSSGTWDGIKLVNSGSSTLEYCEIENANNGIYLDNSSPNITQCYIHNNSSDGIYIKGGSDPELKNNTIKNNSYNGIFCSDYSEPDLGDYSQSGSEGNNRIFDNQTGINATSNSYVMAGIFYDQQTPRCYNNSIYNNTYYDAGANNADIVAQFDWWGTANPDPSQFSTANGGTINHSAALSSDPGGGSSLVKSVGDRLAASSFDPDNVDRDDPESLWKLAQYYRFKKEIDKAIKTNKEIIDRFSSTIYASKAMCQVFHISEKQKLDGLKSYLNSMRGKQLTGKLKATVIDLSIIKSIRDKNYSQAIQLCKNVLEELPDTRSEMLALHNLVTLNNQMANSKGATEYINVLKKKYPDSRLTLMAREIMGENVDWSGAKHHQPEEPQVAETDLPENLELSSAPNPFNPTTNIKFALPEAAKVNISVYNLLGKRVWSYQSNNFKAGYHSVAWHGVDNTGTKVSSGIYIIRIRSKNQQATQKVMLMK